MLFTSWVGLGGGGGKGQGMWVKAARLPCSQQFFANYWAEKRGFLRGWGGVRGVGGETDCPQ